jgi:hypothetical protein
MIFCLPARIRLMEFLETTGRKIRHSGAPYRARSATSASNTTRSISKPLRSARSRERNAHLPVAEPNLPMPFPAPGLQPRARFDNGDCADFACLGRSLNASAHL